MTIAEAKSFYKNDKQKYVINKNKDLLTWLKESIENGYASFIDIEELQELINNIVNWYEFKYPEREMEFYEGVRYFDFENMHSLSKIMNFKELMYRLPHNQLCLMEGNYRSYGFGNRDVYNEKGEIIGNKSILFMRIKRKNFKENYFGYCPQSSDFLLNADSDTGKVDVDYNLDDIVNNKDITLDELLVLFKEKYDDKFDFENLEKCIYDHNCDIELRKRILQLVALKLLYSKNTIPERGYERAKRFINEFNKRLNIDLSTKEIDYLINTNYSKIKIIPTLKTKKIGKVYLKTKGYLLQRKDTRN